VDIRNRKTIILICLFNLVMSLVVFPRLLGPRKIVAWWILMFFVMIVCPVTVITFRWVRAKVVPGFVGRALSRGDYDRALLWMDRMKAPAWHEFRVVILLVAGRQKEAEEILGKSARESLDRPQRARWLTHLADSLMDQGRWEEAKEPLEVAAGLDLGVGGPCSTLAEWHLLQAVEPLRALDLVEQANAAPGLAALKPSVRNSILASRSGTKALALARLGRHHEAESAIAEAFGMADSKSVPGMAFLNWRAGMAFASMEQLSRAREHCQRAAAIDPHGKAGMLAARWLEDGQLGSTTSLADLGAQ